MLLLDPFSKRNCFYACHTVFHILGVKNVSQVHTIVSSDSLVSIVVSLIPHYRSPFHPQDNNGRKNASLTSLR